MIICQYCKEGVLVSYTYDGKEYCKDCHEMILADDENYDRQMDQCAREFP